MKRKVLTQDIYDDYKLKYIFPRLKGYHDVFSGAGDLTSKHTIRPTVWQM